tara:strand:+ start:39 stop:605 length:567 start_codon:yes stop_codon:yes gene_type:complete
MKKILFCFYLLFPLSLICQDSYVENKSFKKFKLQGDAILYNGYTKTLKEAKEIAQEFPSSEIYFEKAKRMRSWNVFWIILGGYEVIAGTFSALNGNGIAFLDIAIGGGLYVMVSNRNKKVKRNIQLGIEAFNNERTKESEIIKKNENAYKQSLSKDRVQQLLDLKKLLDAGVLTKEEFDNEKKKILNQ